MFALVESVTVILAEPLKDTPLMVLAVVKVAAEPVVLWFSVGNVQLVKVPLEGVPSAPPETKLPEAVPVNGPEKAAAVNVVPLNVRFALPAAAFEPFL